jgi:putative DNA primase/helicase
MGEPHADRRLDYCTKITACDSDELCPIPLFLAFLDRVFAGDNELIDYVQKVFGYCCSGSTREHVMFFGYGKGANGKGVLLQTVARILNTYCQPRTSTPSLLPAPINIQLTLRGSWVRGW